MNATPIRRVDDVVFGEVVNEDGQSESLRLDVYLPPEGSPAPKAAILWLHGGGFQPGNDKRQRYIIHFAETFAAEGYVCFASDYRVRRDPHSDPAGTLRDALADGRLALDWVRRHAADYGYAPDRLVLAGGSAGGMLMNNLLHTADTAAEAAAGAGAGAGTESGLLAALNLWGSPGGDFRLYAHVRPTCPPTLIVHGTADALVPYENSQRLAAELEQAGVPCRLLTLQGAPHTPMAHDEQICAEIRAFLDRYQ